MRKGCAGLILILAGGCGLFESDPRPGLRVAVFTSDATPPLGHPLPAREDTVQVVDAPLLLKGILLEDGADRYVVAALDWCTLNSLDYTLFRRKLAEGAGTRPDRVTVHCTHTHSAPTRRHRDLAFLTAVTDRAASAVRAAADSLIPFTHVAVGKAEVEQFASNRRVKDAFGKIRVRWSRTDKPFLIRAPVGKIDPWLRTVSLLQGTQPIVRLHYYATHPQSHYGDGHCHPDVPGWARARIEEQEGIPNLYFTGCAGDITAGKYNDGSKEAREGLIDRLTAAMRASIRASEASPIRSIEWRTWAVRLARHPDDQPPEGGKMLEPIDLILLRLGPADLVHLPGEPFVEYQFHAQKAGRGRFVAVAGYGDGGPGYICTDVAYEEGGYEPTASKTGPPSESILKRALTDLLR